MVAGFGVKSGIVAVAVMSAEPVAAATFDFVSMADNAANPNYIGAQELNWADAFPGGLSIDGITLTASGSNANRGFADAFFDKGNAGLGVCSTTHADPGKSGCATGIGSDPGDDNVNGTQGGETLTLDFGQVVSITSMLFNDDGHVPLTGSIGLNGGVLTVAGGAVIGGFHLLMEQSVFNFRFIGDQFYVGGVRAVVPLPSPVAPVPLPSAGMLLAGAVGGLGVAARRRRRT